MLKDIRESLVDSLASLVEFKALPIQIGVSLEKAELNLLNGRFF